MGSTKIKEDKKWRPEAKENSYLMDSLKAWFPSAEEFFDLLSSFGFDRAKELAEKARNSGDMQGGGIQEKCSLLDQMRLLASNEKMYANLGFMNVYRSILFRKDVNVLKTNYSNICLELAKMINNYDDDQHQGDDVDHHLGEVAQHLRRFVVARLDMMEFYELLANAGTKAAEASSVTAKNLKDPEKLDGGIKDIINSMLMPIEKRILEKLTALESKHSDLLGGTGLKKLARAFNWELAILSNLIHTLHFLNYWDFSNSSIKLARARNHLWRWEKFCKDNYCHQAPTPSSSSSSSSSSASMKLFERFKMSAPQETPTSAPPPAAGSSKADIPDQLTDPPPLFVWLSKLRDTVLTKYTLYFYEELSSKEVVPKDMEDFCRANLPINIIKTIQDFQKMMGAPYVTFIYNATGDSAFKGKCLLEREREKAGSNFSSISDLDLYQPVFTSSMMAKASESGSSGGSGRGSGGGSGDGGAPFFTLRPSFDIKESHLQTMVKGMEEDVWELAMPNTVQHFYNSDFNFTYYIMRVDLCMVCAVIFDSKRRDGDPRVTHFLADISSQLRGCKNFASLKSLGLKA